MVPGRKSIIFAQTPPGSVANRIMRKTLRNPARVSIFGFSMLIAVGTLLLMLPAAASNHRLSWVDALFTATSASCVTGLVVVDTNTILSTFGQAVVLVLIQTGGLGIMTLSSVLLLIAGKRIGMTGRTIVKDTFTHSGERSPASILRDVVLYTLFIEAIGMALLFLRFIPSKSFPDALFFAAFHSVSAYCNAGFALFSDSLIGFSNDWIVNLTICFLIICGGIGFFVLSELRRSFPHKRRTWSRLSLHTKLVLSSSAALLCCGTLFILLMEWHNTLSAMSVPGRLLAAFFQSVSSRTAGFNTVLIENMANETLFLLIVLMFIGASPGSCGGGIKTTTFMCILILGWARLRGKERPHFFYRSISQASVGKAISLVMISVFLVAVGVMFLLMSELGEVPHTLSRGKFLELLFEVVSAFGTVGLSMGVTGGLSTIGKLIITAIMFIGRLGPLVIALAISRQSTGPHYYFAEEGIMIG